MKKLVLIFMTGGLFALSANAQISKSKVVFGSGFEESKSIWKSSIDYQPTINSIQVHSGDKSYEFGASGKCNIYSLFPTATNATVTVWFYDKEDVKGSAVIFLTSNETKETFILGINSKTSANNYVVRFGKDFETTTIKRTTGWHEFKFVFSETGCEYMIDGKSIKKIESGNRINVVKLGSFWEVVNTGSVFFDDFKVEEK